MVCPTVLKPGQPDIEHKYNIKMIIHEDGQQMLANILNL